MSKEIIESIKNTEVEAEQIIENSIEKYKQILIEGNDNAKQMLTKTIIDAENKAVDLKKNAGDEANLIVEEMKQKVIGECNLISEKSESNIDNAIDLIIGRIVNTNGSR